MTGSITPWKATAPSPMVSAVWLACARERRGYLWDGLRAGGGPPSVVGLGLVLVDGTGELWVAPL